MDLRLDAERVRTQEATVQLRGSYDDALRAQQAAAAEHLDVMHRRYEEMAALRRSSTAMELEEARAAALEEQKSLQADVLMLRQSEAALQSQVEVARNAETVESVVATTAHRRWEAEREAVHAFANEAVEDMRAEFMEDRRAQIAEVVSRFEREHFGLTQRFAAEVERRRQAERSTEEVQARFQRLHERAREEWPSPRPQPSAPEVRAVGVQTTETLPLPEREALEMRLADIEGRLAGAADAEARRLELLAQRTGRVVALKNDMIDELKNELGRKEREILEARGILAGARQPEGW